MVNDNKTNKQKKPTDTGGRTTEIAMVALMTGDLAFCHWIWREGPRPGDRGALYGVLH